MLSSPGDLWLLLQPVPRREKQLLRQQLCPRDVPSDPSPRNPPRAEGSEASPLLVAPRSARTLERLFRPRRGAGGPFRGFSVSLDIRVAGLETDLSVRR